MSNAFSSIFSLELAHVERWGRGSVRPKGLTAWLSRFSSFFLNLTIIYFSDLFSFFDGEYFGMPFVMFGKNFDDLAKKIDKIKIYESLYLINIKKVKFRNIFISFLFYSLFL